MSLRATIRWLNSMHASFPGFRVENGNLHISVHVEKSPNLAFFLLNLTVSEPVSLNIFGPYLNLRKQFWCGPVLRSLQRYFPSKRHRAKEIDFLKKMSGKI